MIDVEKALQKDRRQALDRVRKSGLRSAVRLIASGKLSAGKWYDCSVVFGEGEQKIQILARSSSRPRVGYDWQCRVTVDATRLVLYDETERQLFVFRDGPWVDRLTEAANALMRKLEAEKDTQARYEAREKMGNFEEVNF